MRVEGFSSADRRVTSRDLRLASGLAIGAFILCHFANHAIGLVSLDAMEAARPFLSGPWRSWPGTAILYGSVAVHAALSLRTLYLRRTLRLPIKEAAQLALGFALPFMLIGHVVGTRIEFAFSGVEATYPEVVQNFWLRNPSLGGRQAVALLIAWMHFCLGIYFWLRSKAAFQAWQSLLLAGALLVPVLALLGFAEAGKEVLFNPRSLPEHPRAVPAWVEPSLYAAFIAPAVLVLAARSLRTFRRRRDRVRITYSGGQSIDVARGFSVLEASRNAGLPHQAVCGGRARCSTCRVEVMHGAHGQPLPSEMELATLKRIGAGPRVRLACQFRPTHDVEIAQLVSPAAVADLTASAGRPASYGEEREVVVLFCDIRSFTSLAEHRLPYDVVFILNRYFELVARAVTENGGAVDKFVGDGAMALFGLSQSVPVAAKQAFAAAERILADLARMNDSLSRELRDPLRVAIAIHHGPAIVGEVGYGTAANLTAVGDTINVASRLEGLAKEADAELVASDVTIRSAGMSLDGFEDRVLSVRGRSRPLKVWLRRPRKRWNGLSG